MHVVSPLWMQIWQVHAGSNSLVTTIMHCICSICELLWKQQTIKSYINVIIVIQS